VVALRGFMESKPQGQVGALECSDEQRRKIAETSGKWKCEACAKSSAEILKESEAAAKEMGLDTKVEEETPAELKIGFKVKKEDGAGAKGGANGGGPATDVTPTPTQPVVPQQQQPSPQTQPQPQPQPQPQQAPPAVNGYLPPGQEQNGVPAHMQGPLPPYLDPRFAPPLQQAHEETFWLDRIIFALVVLLSAILLKRVLGLPSVY